MPVTNEDVHHVAALARLKFDQAGETAMVEQLNAILGYVDLLQRANTGGVAPTAHPFPAAAPMREDKAQASGVAEALLDNAPEREGRLVVVPRVIE